MIRMVMCGPLSDWSVAYQGPLGITLTNGIWDRRFDKLPKLTISRHGLSITVNIGRNSNFHDYDKCIRILAGQDTGHIITDGIDFLPLMHGPLEDGGLWLVRGTTRYLVYTEKGELFATVRI